MQTTAAADTLGEQRRVVAVEIPEEFEPLFSGHFRHAIIEGGRNSLKSHTAARYILIRGRIEPIRVVCLRQFQANIGDSSYQLLVDLCQQYGFTDYTWTDREIRNRNGTTIIFKGLDRNVETTIKGLEGVDLVWVDEAQTISERSIRILTPTIRKKKSKFIWTLNRITDLDPVIKRFVTDPPRADVWHIKVDYRIAKKYGWIAKEVLDEIEYTRIHDPETYAHDYLGEALNTSDRSIIAAKEVMKAMTRKADTLGAIEIGVDVARFGNDRTVFVKRQGYTEVARETYQHLRTTEVCDRLEQFAGFDRSVLIKIDSGGVGGGVVDEMLTRGYNIVGLNFGGRPQNPDRFNNLISEAWWKMAENISHYHLNENKDLLTELSTREWAVDNRGRRCVESKDAYKRRGYRSPDEADATILAFYEIQVADMSEFDSAGSYNEPSDDDDWND